MKRYLFILFFAAVVLQPVAFAYPPDNAAVIYYKYMLYFETSNDPLWKQIKQVAYGELPVDESICGYMNKEADLIQALQTASTVPDCDWGLDFSKGLSMLVTHLGGMKDYTYLLLADARCKISRRQYREAMDECLAVLRMANHMGSETNVSHLVAVHMHRMTFRVMEEILSVMPLDGMFLIELQRELKLPPYNRLDIKISLLNESSSVGNDILQIPKKRETYLELLMNTDREECVGALTGLMDADPGLLEASSDYFRQLYDRYIEIVDQPYNQAMIALSTLYGKPTRDVEVGKQEALATALTHSPIRKIYNTDIGHRTHQNALLAAMKVYQACAETGQLPAELPADCPADRFSGQPFEYILAPEGFTLRCRQEDLLEKKTHEYTFRVSL